MKTFFFYFPSGSQVARFSANGTRWGSSSRQDNNCSSWVKYGGFSICQFCLQFSCRGKGVDRCTDELYPQLAVNKCFTNDFYEKTVSDVVCPNRNSKMNYRKAWTKCLAISENVSAKNPRNLMLRLVEQKSIHGQTWQDKHTLGVCHMLPSGFTRLKNWSFSIYIHLQ